MFAECDKHYPSRSGQTSLATAVTNITKPVTKNNFGPSILQMRSSSFCDEQFMNALYFSGSYMVMMKEVGQACRVKKGLSPARSPSLQSPRRVAPAAVHSRLPAP